MPELVWNELGSRYFEAGVDQGVLYLADGSGVVWNGLVSVTESPSGGDPQPFYMDGVKYLNVAGRKEFGGTLVAYTYPDEFEQFDGFTDMGNGLSVDEQMRKSFGLSYRTRIGNDLFGQDKGYKIHIIYNALATPTNRDYKTLGEQQDALNFSWNLTTTPVRIDGTLSPLSHVIIDSTKTNPTQLKFMEEYLYGTGGSERVIGGYLYVDPGQEPTLPPLDELITWFADPMVTVNILPFPISGVSPLLSVDSVLGDLKGRLGEGLFKIQDGSKLVESATPGLYTLEP